MIKMEEQQPFIDGESMTGGNGNSDLSFRIILLTHLSRITRISSQEFHGGYWKEMRQAVGGGVLTNHIYVQNTRSQYINAVDCLADMLLPYYDDEMIEAEKDYDSREDELLVALDKENLSNENYNIRLSIERLAIRRNLFRALNKFMKRKNYLDLGDVSDAD